MMEDDLVRLENAVTATASGNLTWELWTLDCAVALGLSGQRNPLGFAVVRYLSDPPSAVNVWNVVLPLAKAMQERDVPPDNIKELAFQAFEYWRDRRCVKCGGRGVSSIDQKQCQACNGTGHRPMETDSTAVLTGISCLIEAERWMEGQLASKMKRL